jgi:hypothetical protein
MIFVVVWAAQTHFTSQADLPTLLVSFHVPSTAHCSGKSGHIPRNHDVQKVAKGVST